MSVGFCAIGESDISAIAGNRGAAWSRFLPLGDGGLFEEHCDLLEILEGPEGSQHLFLLLLNGANTDDVSNRGWLASRLDLTSFLTCLPVAW
jgi:hypothetical protein